MVTIQPRAPDSGHSVLYRVLRTPYDELRLGCHTRADGSALVHVDPSWQFAYRPPRASRVHRVQKHFSDALRPRSAKRACLPLFARKTSASTSRARYLDSLGTRDMCATEPTAA